MAVFGDDSPWPVRLRRSASFRRPTADGLPPRDAGLDGAGLGRRRPLPPLALHAHGLHRVRGGLPGRARSRGARSRVAAIARSSGPADAARRRVAGHSPGVCWASGESSTTRTTTCWTTRTGRGSAPRPRRERDLILGILSIADLVTAATPVLAARLLPHTRADVRVVRNAVDPAWYAARRRTSAPEPLGDLARRLPRRFDQAARLRGRPSGRGHGAPVRRPACAASGSAPRKTRAWPHAWTRSGPGWTGWPPSARRWSRPGPISGLRRCWTNRSTGPRASSTGSSTPWQAPPRSPPHSTDRVRTTSSTTAVTASWPEPRPSGSGTCARLAASGWLRSELAGRARERVVAEYGLSTRTAEWADSYRWAAAHAGSGRAYARAATKEA